MAVITLVSIFLLLSTSVLFSSPPGRRPFTPIPPPRPQIPTPPPTHPPTSQPQHLREMAAAIITQICSRNYLKDVRGIDRRWDTTEIPNLTITRYLNRFECKFIINLSCIPDEISIIFVYHRAKRYIKCHESTFVLALIFIGRYNAKNPALALNYYNIYRLLAVALTVAHKVSDDIYWSNSYYARVLGLPLKGNFIARI